MSLSARRAWIEIVFARNLSFYKWSLSARRAWIEIKIPRAITDTGLVALRKESVDRNKLMFCKCVRQVVALRKESVDRNLYHEPDNIRSAGSLSARRAWIEISRPSGTLRWTTVALRKESVDRNLLSPLNSQRLLSRSPQGERG